jgi:hypothetical protein
MKTKAGIETVAPSRGGNLARFEPAREPNEPERACFFGSPELWAELSRLVQLVSRFNNVKYTIIPYYYYVLNYFIEFLELDTWYTYIVV